MTSVTPTSDVTFAAPSLSPISVNCGITYTPSFSAPKAADKKPQTVTPT